MPPVNHSLSYKGHRRLTRAPTDAGVQRWGAAWKAMEYAPGCAALADRSDAMRALGIQLSFLDECDDRQVKK